MNVVITSFTEPFSFFCIAEDDTLMNKEIFENISNVETQTRRFSSKTGIQVTHAQYVAVQWKNKWTRGVVNTENEVLIWLIDYGFYIRPDDKAIYIELSPEHRRYPTKVFEASIHGVTPVDKVLSYDCQIVNEASLVWTEGTIKRAMELISSAKKIHFVPLALLTTANNDIVLGDIFIDLPDKGFTNLTDELELWPVHLQKNKAAYIQNLSIFYPTRRRHRASAMKPKLLGEPIPTMTLSTTLEEYSAILLKSETKMSFQVASKSDIESVDGSTVIGKYKKEDAYILTEEEIEQYSQMYITIGDREYNVLNALLNKIRDLNMCERYKNHDKKRAGRGYKREKN